MTEITNSDDVIDSRSVIERIAELSEQPLDFDEDRELSVLVELARQGADCFEDWQFGVGLIRDGYFVDYARELAEDIGAISDDAKWPATCIDWEQAARELRQDYTSIEFDGVTYWAR